MNPTVYGSNHIAIEVADAVVRFKPPRAFATPRHIFRLIRPDPRDIDLTSWYKLAHAAATSRTESLILWRRIAGGLTQAQQRALAQPLSLRRRAALSGSALQAGPLWVFRLKFRGVSPVRSSKRIGNNQDLPRIIFPDASRLVSQ